jgi:hypothetical protein
VRFTVGIDWLCVCEEVGNLRMYNELTGRASGRTGRGKIIFYGRLEAVGK